MKTNPLQTMTVKTNTMGGKWSCAADSLTSGALSSLLAAAAAVADRVFGAMVAVCDTVVETESSVGPPNSMNEKWMDVSSKKMKAVFSIVALEERPARRAHDRYFHWIAKSRTVKQEVDILVFK